MLDSSCCSLRCPGHAAKCHNLAQTSRFLGRSFPRSPIFHAGQKQRSTPSSHSGAGTLQLPGVPEGSQVTDIFQSALNALDLASPSDSYRGEFGDPHEDISVEHGQAASQVGKAVYEVSHPVLQLLQRKQHAYMERCAGPESVKDWQDTAHLC